MTQYDIKEEGGFRFIETKGEGEPLVLFHGLFGALSNFEGILGNFGKRYNVVVPILPILEISFRSISVMKLVEHMEAFIAFKKFTRIHVLGNSLGGHIAQLYTLRNEALVKTMTLTGSSGLFESAMGTSFPKRGNYEYIKAKAEDVFYNPSVATKELVDEVYSTVNDLKKAMCVVAVAKSAVRHNLEDQLNGIKVPTLLIWGIQDAVTPLWVGEKFNALIPNSVLVSIDKCGHAPMMERPELFNRALEDFLQSVKDGTFMSTGRKNYTLS
jgi:2-hydroxy-6-oxonona-2,4-dienedioate hydrolase